MSAGHTPSPPLADSRQDAGGADRAAGRQPTGLRLQVRAVISLLDRPLASYYLLIGVTGLLLVLGLVMVLSTSSATQLYNGFPEYAVFEKQLIGVLVGLPMMWLLSKSPPAVFRAVAYPLLIASVVGLVLVLAFGETVAGATRWISIAGFEFQPSEFAKLAFLLWGADLLARKEKLGQLTDPRTLLIPLMPGVAVLGLLVMLGDDLGTTCLLLVIFLALLWVVGTPIRLFIGMLGLLGFAGLMVVLVASYGQGRITCFLHPQSQAAGNCWQLLHGKVAIGSGGLFGVGLGEGTEKWGWVPNASTDFIFAILGEELGLVGTACVVLLYGGVAYAGLRIARRVTDPFMRLAAAGATAWIVTQGLVNIGAVIGLVPITGVPLPLISAGLSSLLATMAALGMLLSFARQEPGASQALAARGPGLSQRALGRLGLGALFGRTGRDRTADRRPERSRQRGGAGAARTPGRSRPAAPGAATLQDQRMTPAGLLGSGWRPGRSRPGPAPGRPPGLVGGRPPGPGSGQWQSVPGTGRPPGPGSGQWQSVPGAGRPLGPGSGQWQPGPAAGRPAEARPRQAGPDRRSSQRSGSPAGRPGPDGPAVRPRGK